jgi:type I restriction enzyme S subunit
LYGSGGIMGYVNKHLYDKPSVLIPRKGSLNNIVFIDKPFWCVDTMFFSILKKDFYGCYSYYFLISKNFNSLDVGSAVPSMTTEYLNAMPIIIPSDKVLKSFDFHLKNVLNQIEFRTIQNLKLEEFKSVLLSKLATIEV